MKSALLCLLVGLSFSTSAQKIRFTDTSNHWVYIKPDDCHNPTWFEYTHFGYDGDTTVNGTIYQKLFQTAPGPVLLGLIREDTIARKVYIKHPTIQVMQNVVPDTMERILFDYALSVGDTIKFDHYDTISNIAVLGRSILFSVDSVLINGTWHIKQKFIPKSSYYWANSYDVIEGIGSRGFNPIAPVFAAGECPPTVMCFRHQGNLPALKNIIFQNNTSCHLSVEQVDFKNGKITVSPNPFNNSTKVVLPHLITKGRITIFNHLGQTIHTKQITRQQELNIEDFHHPPGVYILEVRDEVQQKGTYTKVMVTN